jgi:hypothetical protein
MEQLKKAQTYDVPKKLRKTLGKDEYAIYRLLNSFDEKGKFHGRDHSIPVTDVIMDPEAGEPVTIGYVERVLPGGKVKFGSIWFDTGSLCQIIVMPGVAGHNLYNYLENSNYNISNPNRDTTIHPSFERVASTKGVQESRDKNRSIILAMNAATNFSNEEVLDFVRSNKDKVKIRIVNLPDGKPDFDTIRNQIENFSKLEPKRFLGMVVNKPVDETDDGIRSIVDQAVKEGKLSFDVESKQFYNKVGKGVFTASNGDQFKAKEELAGFLATKAGDKLKKLLI